jgi:hypothetical protein
MLCQQLKPKNSISASVCLFYFEMWVKLSNEGLIVAAFVPFPIINTS